MKSLGDDSLPIDVTRDERIDSNREVMTVPPTAVDDTVSPQHLKETYNQFTTPDNVDISRHPLHVGFLVSFLVDARGGAMRGCRHSGVRVIVPPRRASMPMRVTCRYLKRDKLSHPPPLMEGEALASRILEFGPVGAKFLGPVMIEVPHFGSLRGKEREIVILRSDNGETWREHTVEANDEAVQDILSHSFDKEEMAQLEDASRTTRILTTDFPHYFAVVTRVRQEVHAIGPEGGMVSSSVVPQVQAVFPQGALTKKIKVGLQAQPISAELAAKLLGNRVAVSPIVTVEPRRRKFHKPITLTIPKPQAANKGMINQYSGDAPTLRLLCSITGGTTRAQWEDVTGSTPFTFVNDCVSFTTTVSARFWLMDCRNISDASKMATELYKEAIHVPFMAKFVVFSKRVDVLEARLRVFCMTDDKEDKTLEHQEHFTEVAKSRDVEVLEGKSQYIEFAGNLIPVTKSGEQLQLGFRAFRENRLPFTVRVKDPHADTIGRMLFMREPKVAKGEPPQQPICILNIVLPEEIIPDTGVLDHDLHKYSFIKDSSGLESYQRADLRLSDISNLLGEDWVRLAGDLGVTTSDVNRLKSEYPNSDAQQGLAMLRLWVQQAGNKAQASTLEAALNRIGRDDIVQQCIFNIDQSGFDLLKEELGPSRDASLKRNINVDNVFSDQEIMKDTVSREEITRVNGRKAGEPVEKDDKEESKYIAEEKEVEEVKKSVSERRKEIEERLSSQEKQKDKIIEKRPSKDKQLVEETVVVTQKQKIVEDLSEKEIPEEKKFSQDQFPEPSDLPFEQKRLSFEQGKKIIEMKPDKMKFEPKERIEEKFLVEERKVSTIIDDKKTEAEEKVLTFQEKRMSFEQGLKQSESLDKEVKHTVEDKRTEERRLQDQRRDSELFEGVSQGLVRLDIAAFVATPQVQDILSPKVSKTPPPSPAEFSRDTTGTVAWEDKSAAFLSTKTSTAQDWSKKSEKPVEEPTAATVADSQEKLESSRFIESEHGLHTDGSDSSPPKPTPRIPKHDSSDESIPKSAAHIEEDVKDYSVRKKFWEQISTGSIESEVKVQQRSQDSVTPPVPRPRSSIVTSVPLLKSEAESDTETTATTLSDSTVRIKNLQHDAVSKQSFTGSSDASDKEEGSEPEAVDLSGQILVQSVPTTAPPVVSEITDEHSSKDDQTAVVESSDSEAEYIAGKISGGGTLAYENIAFDAGEEIVEDKDGKLPEGTDKSKISVTSTQFVTEKTTFSDKGVPIAAVRKTVYERSVSLPTEDITDVPASSVRARKRFFEAQIKKEMVVDQLMTQLEEESSPEHKALHYKETDKPTADPEAMVSRQIHSHIFSHELEEQIESLIPESKHIVEEKTEIVEEIKPVTVKEIASVFDKIDAKKSVKRIDSVSYEAEVIHVEPDVEKVKLVPKDMVSEVVPPTEMNVDRKEVKDRYGIEKPVSVEETSVSKVKELKEKSESEPEKTVKEKDETEKTVVIDKSVEGVVKEEKVEKSETAEEKVVKEEKFVKGDTSFEEKYDIKDRLETQEKLIKEKSHVQEKLLEPVILDSIIDYEVVEEEVLDILPCKEAVISDDIAEVMQYKSEGISKPSDSLEVHIDKSEIEETEKEREIDEEIKQLEGEEKTVKPTYYYGEEEAGQSVSGTPTSKQTESYSQGESEDTQSESDVTPEDAQAKQLTLGDWEQVDSKQEVGKKMDLEVFHSIQDQCIHTPEEHIPDTVWEVPVQQEPETIDQEVLQDIPIGNQIIVEKDEDDSQRSLTESLDVKIIDKEGDEIHDENKISVEDARQIAEQVVDDIEAEIAKRTDVTAEFDEVASTPAPSADTAQSQVSEYLMQLTGKEEMDVKLIESVLAKKQREHISKFARTDTTTSSMEITDEDLRSSGVDTDMSPIESQASKLYPVEDKSEDDTESFLKYETELREDMEKLKEKEVLEKTLAEVKKSLEAAQEELIEEHKKKKDSVQKKESPSEFEFKVLSLDRTTEELIEESHFEDSRATASIEGISSDGKRTEGAIDARIQDTEVSKQTVQEHEQVQSEYLREDKKEIYKDIVEQHVAEKGEIQKETKVDEKIYIKSGDTEIKMEQKGSASLSDDDGKIKSSKLEHVTVFSDEGVVSKVSSEEREEETIKKGETYDFESKTEELEDDKKVVKEEHKKEDTKLEELRETTATVQGIQEIFEDGTFVTEKSIEKYKVSTSTKTESREEYHTESKIETSSKYEVDPSMIEHLMSEGLLQDDGHQVVVKVVEKEEIKRTYSEESQKSSQDDSIRSPVGADDVVSSSSSSGRRGDSDTMHTLERPEVVMRRHKTVESRAGHRSADRRSGTDYEPYSSSGESHYHSFEQTSESIRTPSRPCSSDVEALIAGVAGTTGSSEYESAISHEISARSVTSHEYHTAVSSLSSRESMKSLDSESSGNLASVEVSSEASETLVPSAMELEKDMESISGPIGEEEIMLKSVVEPYDTEIPHHVILGESPPRIPSLSEVKDQTQSVSLDISAEEIASEEEPEAPAVETDESVVCRMKRSHEMTFQPEPRPIISETPPISESSSHEEKLGSSIDDAGSVISLSSVSDGTALKTVIELSRTESDKMDGSGTSDQLSLTVSGTSEQFSLSSELREETASVQTSRQETTISTQSTSQSGQVSSVTITTSAVSEDGIQSVCTQVTSQTEPDIVSTADESLEDGYTCSNGPTQVEYNSEYDEIKEVKKRPGHRRIESTTVKRSMIPVLTKRHEHGSFITEKPEGDTAEDMAESDKYADTSPLTLKEGRCEEKKDIDEAERVEEESYTEADQGFHRELREGRLLLEDTSSIDEDQDDREGEISRPQSQVSKSDSESGQRPMSAGFSDDRPDSELAELLKQCSSDAGSEDPIERPKTPEPVEECEIKDDTPEFSSEAQASVTELEIEYSGAFSRAVEYESHVSPIREKAGMPFEAWEHHTSDHEEELAEAEAAFQMVPHVSPSVPAMLPATIPEDPIAEKHELETRELLLKEDDKICSKFEATSPGSIPDITVTQHMTPLVDQGFHYPDLELEEETPVKVSAPQTPASMSSHASSETETDQGREYVLQEEDGDDYIAEEPDIEVSATTEEKTVFETKDTEVAERDSATESPTSDSFEMLEKPDISDEFVIIEEVGKEAHEQDREGKSVSIEKKRIVKKTDDTDVVVSPPAPATKMTDLKYYPAPVGDDMGPFPFDSESPPTNLEETQSGGETTSQEGSPPTDEDQAYENEVEAGKKWIEMQFQGDQLTTVYGYDIEYERGPLEDIKEEDPTDLEQCSSKFGSMGSQVSQSIGSFGSVKESLSSTPDYDVLAGRKYFTRSGEHDDVSMSSLQEFERLEKLIAMESRNKSLGSQDSLTSSGNSGKRLAKSGGDDISLSSLKEFEGLETACIEAAKIETKAKEEEALLSEIEEGHESQASECESCETISAGGIKDGDSDSDDYEKRMFEIDEIIRQAQTNVERFVDLKTDDRTESVGRGDSLEEVAKVPDLDLDQPLHSLASTTVKTYSGKSYVQEWKDIEDEMLTSTDSLEVKTTVSKSGPQDVLTVSTDSLEVKPTADKELMSQSTDSIECQLQQKKSKPVSDLMTDSIEIPGDKTSLITSTDSLEMDPPKHITDSIEEEEEDMCGQAAAVHDQSSSSGREGDLSSSGKEDSGEQNRMPPPRAELALGSTDSLDPSSSTATHATYQYETDSVMSSSFTSGGSNTMVSSTETLDISARAGVWFEDGRPYVTEVIEPESVGDFSHTIHRTVELPPEVHKVTFHGPDAEKALQEYIEKFAPGEDMTETRDIDKDGNVHIKRVIQRRVLIRPDELGGPTTDISGADLQEYLRQLSEEQRDDHGVTSSSYSSSYSTVISSVPIGPESSQQQLTTYQSKGESAVDDSKKASVTSAETSVQKEGEEGLFDIAAGFQDTPASSGTGTPAPGSLPSQKPK